MRGGSDEPASNPIVASSIARISVPGGAGAASPTICTRAGPCWRKLLAQLQRAIRTTVGEPVRRHVLQLGVLQAYLHTGDEPIRIVGDPTSHLLTASTVDGCRGCGHHAIGDGTRCRHYCGRDDRSVGAGERQDAEPFEARLTCHHSGIAELQRRQGFRPGVSHVHRRARPKSASRRDQPARRSAIGLL
jgi:hypothetical protein